ncbi:MAG: 50S ribosomal protein L16 [Candidatus Colwellbacteria bacterium RIFCSPLOWO2_01_FULL_48_10]|uniref:Large ribosomal subunit protein uL16 n=1 Tax=Candidatus Colwellbacteria bacterium RIFCSPLOWO2_01_FULL_48_10 TaxID=1797690 RepID=A0A1G1Z6V6_9BACT|nr:MAG: 50S ribosomal protein L16 [Candidatus Colwellbacteria bacterium RIFCSPLOWO2_01_FULL_48_10]
MLLPKKVKHRKWHKGRSKDRMVETRGTSVAYGSYGLQATEPFWITSRQIEAGRRTITNFVKRGGKVWIRVFPDKPVTVKPPGVTMGGGKGAVTHYVFPVRPGRIIFEMDGISEEIAKKALVMAGHKLPFTTKFVKKV